MVNMLPPHEYNLINLILFGNHNHTFGQNLVGLGRWLKSCPNFQGPNLNFQILQVFQFSSEFLAESQNKKFEHFSDYY